MAASKRLAAHRASAPIASDDEIPAPNLPEEENEKTTPASTTKETSMNDETKAAVATAHSEGHSAGFKAANDRMNAVFASDHYAGREPLARAMLANEKLSAEDIIGCLQAAPKAAAPKGADLSDEEKRKAAEEGGRSEMKSAIEETGNSNIDPSGGGNPGGADKAKAASDSWDRVYADLNPKSAR